jgi:regulator of protease activity HflC (stomatin/prohibitin superfamily)
MSIVYQILEFLKQLLNWWFVVESWEQAVRVRFGKRLKLFGPGVHVKIPFFDRVYIQNVRRRVMSMGMHTTTTRDGQVVTLTGSLGYRITDVLKLHQTLHDAEGSVLQEVQGLVSRYVASHVAADCTPERIMAEVNRALPLEQYGLGECDFFLGAYVANIPAFRLIQESLGGYVGGSGLSTGGGMAHSPQPVGVYRG